MQNTISRSFTVLISTYWLTAFLPMILSTKNINDNTIIRQRQIYNLITSFKDRFHSVLESARRIHAKPYGNRIGMNIELHIAEMLTRETATDFTRQSTPFRSHKCPESWYVREEKWFAVSLISTRSPQASVLRRDEYHTRDQNRLSFVNVGNVVECLPFRQWREIAIDRTCKNNRKQHYQSKRQKIARATRQKTKEKETHSVERQATQARGCSVAMLTNVT